MGLFDIPQVGEIIGIAKRVIAIIETVLKNTDIKERWNSSGRAPFKFSVYDYNVSVIVEDKRKTAIQAEVVEAAVDLPNGNRGATGNPEPVEEAEAQE